MHLRIVAVILMLVVFVSCARQNTNKTSEVTRRPPGDQPRNSVDVVKANAPDVAAKPGDEVEATVQLSIDKGYHVNANPPTFPYLKATTLEIATTPGVTLNRVAYPDPITKSFPFAEKPLSVYEGSIDLKAKLKVDKSAKSGLLNLPAKLNVQACDDQVCYAPGTLTVNIPLSVK